MSLRKTLKFLFGSAPGWEYKLVYGRLILLFAGLLCMYVLINSDYKRYAIFFFLLLVVAFLISVFYQYRRRWKELNRKEG